MLWVCRQVYKYSCIYIMYDELTMTEYSNDLCYCLNLDKICMSSITCDHDSLAH